MKNHTIRSPFVLSALLLSLFFVQPLRAQDLDAAAVKALVENRTWLFRPQTANPMTGGTQQLTPGFDLSVRRDSLSAYLPYFGRSFTPVFGNEGGIRLATQDFTYASKSRKRGGWEVSIRPRDNRNVRELFLIVSDKGYATLQVSSNNRQPISFSGYITQ